MSKAMDDIFGDNSIILGVEEVPILDVLRKKENKLRQTQQLNKQENEEYQVVNNNHSELLEEYQQMWDSFSSEWELRLADYTKEIEKIKSKYRKLRKELRNAE